MLRIHELFLFTLRKIYIPILNLFDISLKLSGFPIKEAQLALQKIQNKNETEFKAYINERKQAIVDYHLKHTPYYKQLVNNVDLTNWNSIPIMTKKDLQQPLGDRLSKDYSPKNVYINKTSGSSGNPFIFAKDKFCHALTWALIKDRFGWYKLDFNSSKQARFYGIPLDKKSYYKERFKDALSKRYRFSVFDLSDTAFNECLVKFKASKFDYINGYTSSIVQFAKYLQKENIQLKQVCPTLKACIVTSEMLFEDDKKLMELQFGIPVINEYGASELDIIAFQNTKNEWQVTSETLWVEILDENNQILPYGEEGRIVITSFYNKAHPFIRYDIGDIGILSKESTFKKPILEKLTGRTNDIAILPSGKKASGLTFYYITKSIIETDGNVKEFIIEQSRKEVFNIKYVSSEVLSSEKKNQILKEMERYLEGGLQVNFEQLDKLERSKSGKLKQFSSLIKETK
ncbi:phenylacetate--CoA ligase family protein [Xanthomarina sp. F1114]|uniref:phenylacetate--CoA ligase family protein n=1 Tax=Xanthomarina sp. F1114 TaxID=2996019 RepID=UPI00225E65C2|nr:phenylacetate--CoA ligase family protein [Xanthomarina sp. F1114]MCX7546551.1 phenylacetate--CoA ligase family protein [Xanthomarina sp. F1114]